MLWLLLSCLVCAHPIQDPSSSTLSGADAIGIAHGSPPRRHDTSSTPRSRSFHFDVYDRRGNRVGYGKTHPYDGSIQIYDKRWNRTHEVKPYGGSRRTR
jgi:hypothetical protein